MQEALSPTRERFAKGDSFEAPEYTQTTKRDAFRFNHPFETMFKRGQIDHPCKEAGMRLVHHHQGMLGGDVRVTGEPFIPRDGEAHRDEFPSLRHGEQVRRARACILSKNTKSCYAVWQVLVGLVEETCKLEDIGRQWGHDNAVQARAAGLTVVQSALEELAVLWGLSQHARPPNR